MKEPKPACVYAPLLTLAGRDRLYTQLHDLGLYFVSRNVERPEHRDRPILARPELMRLMFYARMHVADTFVTDHLSSLGAPAEHCAVVSVLNDAGNTVVVDGEVVTRDRLQRLTATAHLDEVTQLQDQLESYSYEAFLELLARDVYGSLDAARDNLLPNNWLGGDRGEAALRAQELLLEMTPTQAARVLRVEGWRNPSGNLSWHPQAVRKAAEDTKAQQSALDARAVRAARQEQR